MVLSNSALRRRGRLRALSSDERRLILRNSFSLPVVTLLLRVIGFRRTRALLGRLAEFHRRQGVPSGDEEALLAEGVRMVERVPPPFAWGSTCLSRALSAWLWLRRRGVACEVRLGVRRQPSGMQAHAWVEDAEAPEAAVDGYLVIYSPPPT